MFACLTNNYCETEVWRSIATVKKYIKEHQGTHDILQASYEQMATEVVRHRQSGLIEFFHISTITKLANRGKSVELSVDQYALCLLLTEISSKEKIYETIGLKEGPLFAVLTRNTSSNFPP